MHAVWTIGFRPFFLLGSLISIPLIIYWAVSFYTGDLPGGYFDPILWHAHEMVIGFAVAIVAGFLLTASANWTRTQPQSGHNLKILVGLWLAGRVVMVGALSEVPISFRIVITLLDMSFLPALLLALAPPLLRAKQMKNIQFIPIILLLMLANLLMHLASLEAIAYDFANRAIYLSVNLILVIMVLIGGRIIPFFTENALPSAKPQRYPALEWGSSLSVWLFIILDFIPQTTSFSAWAALLAGFLNGFRWLGWRPWRTLSVPLLWILHAGYLWIVVGFFLIFLSDTYSLLPRSVAVHAFTAGAMGTFIIGMMSRVSLGHSGRPLKLAKGFVAAYSLVLLSSIIRVISGFFPAQYETGILLSGCFWAASFLLYLTYYSKILLTPRPDGKLG